MAHYQSYQCPDCNGTFRFLHHPDDECPPDYCPLCGNFMGDTPELTFVPEAPHVAKTIGKTADNVYRMMEETSVHNARAVEEMTGVEASNMKITDAQDYLRPGDQAAKMPSAPAAAISNGQGGFQPLMGQTGRDYAAAASQGAYAHAGEATRQLLASGHSQRARMVQAKGEIARYGGGK